MAHKHEHQVPLWALFLILLALTAAEVGFYEIWKHTAQQGEPFVPKIAMVLVLLVILTVPKALIVLIYFMHLKYEKQFILVLATLPFLAAAIAVLPTVTDTRVLKPHAYNQPAKQIGYYPAENGHGPATSEEADTAADEPSDPYSY